MDLDLEGEALSLFEAGEYAAARKLFRKLINGATTSDAKDAAKFNEANCHAAEGEPQKALEIFAELGHPANDIELVYSRTLCLVKLAKFDAAIAQLDKLAPEESAKLAGDSGDGLLRALLDLIAVCANSSHHWKNYHTNCGILESLLLRLRQPICSPGDEGLWQRNMAHVMFMMDTCYEDCAQLYHDLMLTAQQQHQQQQQQQQLASPSEDADEPVGFATVDPEVLRNLCVSYILTSQNRDAEQLIKEVELEVEAERAAQGADLDLAASLYDSNGDSLKAELDLSGRQSDLASVQLMHLNLAVGTLYCVKNNFEFGLARIMGTLEPVNRRLNTFAWNQAKRCILSLLDKLCRQLIYAKDDLLDQLVAFLIRCEAGGLKVPVHSGGDVTATAAAAADDDDRNSVTHEARHLRAILLSVIHD